MGRPPKFDRPPAPDRSGNKPQSQLRTALSITQARMYDLVRHHATTAALARVRAELADSTEIQACRATSLWDLGASWAVVSIDVTAQSVTLYDEQGIALDAYTQLTTNLAAKPPHQVQKNRKKGK